MRDTELALVLSPLDLHRFFYDSLAASANLTAGNYARALDLAYRSLRANRMRTPRRGVFSPSHSGSSACMRKRANPRNSYCWLEPALTICGYLDRTPGQHSRSASWSQTSY